MSASLSSGDAAIDAAAAALARHVVEMLPAARAHGRDALASLPPALARPLLARLDARVDREAPAPESDWVDPERARDGMRAWRGAAREAARVPASAWTLFLGDTCRLVVSHLARPAETLAAVAFEEADADAEVPTAVALRRLGTFAPYPYLPEVAARYVERKGLARVDRPELEGLLRRIDRRMVAGFSADEWSALLDPLVSLLGPLAPDSGVPTGLVAAFFEAKGRVDLADALLGEPSYTASALRARLTRALPPPEAAAPEAAAPEAAPQAVAPAPTPPALDAHHAEALESVKPVERAVEKLPDVEVRDEAPATEAPLDPHTEPVQNVPEIGASTSMWLAEAAQLPAETTVLDADPASNFSSPIPEAPVPVQETRDAPEPAQPLWKQMMASAATADPAPADPLWKQFVSRPDSGAPAPRRPTASPQPDPRPAAHAERPAESPASDDLDRLEGRALGGPVDPERRAWFVAELFSGSEADYRTALTALAAAPSWADATAVLSREMFLKHRVNAYSEAATALMDAAEARFHL